MTSLSSLAKPITFINVKHDALNNIFTPDNTPIKKLMRKRRNSRFFSRSPSGLAPRQLPRRPSVLSSRRIFSHSLRSKLSGPVRDALVKSESGAAAPGISRLLASQAASQTGCEKDETLCTYKCSEADFFNTKQNHSPRLLRLGRSVKEASILPPPPPLRWRPGSAPGNRERYDVAWMTWRWGDRAGEGTGRPSYVRNCWTELKLGEDVEGTDSHRVSLTLRRHSRRYD